MAFFRIERLGASVAALGMALVSAFFGGFAQAEALKPHKDALFAYPDTLSESDRGALRVVDYREMRDINERDEVPERRVRRNYVALGVRASQKDLKLTTDAGDVTHVAVGKREGARYITVYLHGKGGNRRQGADDFTFGGNFNRIKNLMAENGGLYLSPDFRDFEAKGEAQIVALIEHYAAMSPGAPVFVACGSMGGLLCWRLADDGRVAGRLGGLLLLGSLWDEGFLKSAAAKRSVPVFFGHGSRDSVFPQDRQIAFFRQVSAIRQGYPARFVSFESGSHGTPIRMTDWRETLNWMLSVPPR